MWRAAYNLVLAPVWAVLSVARPLLRGEFRERMGEVETQPSGGALWIHCASVGELSAIEGMVQEMRANEADRRIVISTMTETGRARAKALFPEAYSFVLPLDFPLFVRKTLERINPSVLFIVETELWPNLLTIAADRGVRVVVLNGRLSAGSLRMYLTFRSLFAEALRGVRRFFVQTDSDSAAYQKLGVPAGKISVTGTMKSDMRGHQVESGALLEEFAIPEDMKVFVAGSVRPDEEEDVLKALSAVHRELPSSYSVVAPRHLQRVQNIAARARELGFEIRFRSNGSIYSGERLLLLDTIGELSMVYGLAHVSFVGGSLKPYGGHNVLEPAMWGVPVLFGEFTENCNEEAEELVSCGGGMRVANSDDLASAALKLLLDEELRETTGRNARAVVQSRSGVSRGVYQTLKAEGPFDRRADGR